MRRRVVNLMRYDWKTVAAAAAAICATFAPACTKTETSITAPSEAADRCALTVTSNPNSFPSPGGKGSLTISTARDCTWSVASNASWVALGGASGQGEGTIPYTVAANPVPSPRSAAIAVGAQSVAVSQQAAPCIFSLSRANDTIGETGGKLSVSVTTLSGCRWTAASTAAWISVASGQSADGNGTVGLTIAANAGAARVGQVNIAGQTYTVSQAAAASGPSPTPPSPVPGPTPPGPTPTPTPGPAPTPRHVEFSGTISSVFGRCPSVVFTAGGRAISVDESTDFQRSKCGDLKEDREVGGEGDVQANGVIRATIIRVAKKDDDH
jgi:Viral BACON domain/Putative binding domain, N-terminal